MDLFEVKKIDGTELALFHLSERENAFHSKDNFFENYTNFLSVVSAYCHKVEITNPSDIDIARTLFGSQSSKEHTIRIVAYLIANYVDAYLLAKMTKDNAERFKSKVDYLGIDFEYFSYRVETVIYSKKLPTFSPLSGRRPNLHRIDSMFAMKSLFYIETIEKIEDIWSSDMIAGSIMYLRLYIDELLKKFIDYKSLVNSNGKIIEKTGVRRGFLESEIKKRINGQPSVITDEGEILVYAYKWSCDSVHYGSLPLDCITDWIILYVCRISKIYNDEALMKSELQTFISTIYPKEALSLQW